MALILYLALLVSRAAFSVGGSDSSGYFNTARALDAGSLVERAAAYDSLGLEPNRIHVVLPLGFVPGPRIGTMAPFYPVGLPLHMLVAGRLAGWKTGPFLVSPVAATLSVLLIALLAREFGLRAIGCVWAAVILAVCPVFVFQALQPMSDVVATFWALLAILAALRACNRRRWAAISGLALGIGALVRPTSTLFALPVFLVIPLRARRLAAFFAGALPSVLILFAYDSICYGHPLRTGYGAGGAFADFALANFLPRFRHYARWLLEMLGPPLAAWAIFLACRDAPSRDRALFAAWLLPCFLFYCFYGPYETWWYTRYLLPAIPALILAMLLAFQPRTERLPNAV